MNAQDLMGEFKKVQQQYEEGAIFAWEGVYKISALIGENIDEVVREQDERIAQGLDSGDLGNIR